MKRQIWPYRTLAAALSLLALLVQPVTAQTPSIEDGEPETRTVSFTTTEGTALGFDISPDGKTIVFDLLGQLWMMPAEGGEAVPLTDAVADVAEDLNPSFSPDGEWIVFQGDRQGQEGLWILPSEGGEPRLLPGTEFRRNIRWKLYFHPAWSPDGSQIVFNRERRTATARWSTSKGGLYLYDVARDTTTKIALQDSPEGTFQQPSWLPDGRLIARVSSGGLRLIDLETGVSHEVNTGDLNASSISVAPGGDLLAYFALYQEDRYELWLQSLEDGEVLQLSKPDDIPDGAGFNPPLRPRWTADGQMLLYSAGGRLWRAPIDGITRSEIPFTANIAFEREEAELPLVHFPDPGSVVPARGHRGLALSPDGQRIALIALGQLWVWPLDGEPKSLAELPATAEGLTWAPDGGTVAWSAGPAGGEDLYLTELDTGHTRRLSKLEGRAIRPSWSPDGQHIAFLYWPRAAFPLSDDPEHNQLHLALIPVMTEQEPVDELSHIRILDEVPRSWIWVHGMQPMGQDLPAWSPASDALLFYDGVEELRIVPLDGEPMAIPAIHGPMTFLHWAADLSLVYVQGAQLWRADIHDGALTEPILLMEEATLYPSLARDGTMLFIGGDGYGLRRADGTVEELGWPLTYEIPVSKPLLVRNARLINGTGTPPDDLSDLLIERGRISQIGVAGSIEPAPGVEIIDAGGRTMLPGLIDLHIHGRDDLTYAASLYHGATTVREMGAPIARTAALSDAAAAGRYQGPRVVLGGFMINPGSHINFSGATYQNAKDREAWERALVLAQAFDASFVKMQFPGTWAAGAELIREAHARGMRIGGHCAHPLPLIAAGVKQVEHVSACFPARSWANPRDDFIQLYREAGVTAIPTLSVISALVLSNTDPTLRDDPDIAPFLTPYKLWSGGYHAAAPSDDHWGYPVMARGEEEVGRLHEHGIRIGVGTDAPDLPGAIHLELEDLVRSGLTPMEAIIAATATAARVLGAHEEIGTIEEGKWADLLLLDADPLENIRNTRRIWKVIKGGEVVDREAILEWAREQQ